MEEIKNYTSVTRLKVPRPKVNVFRPVFLSVVRRPPGVRGMFQGVRRII